MIPAWQFDAEWGPLPHLPAALAALGDVSAETAVSVMTTPTTDLGDTRVVPKPVTPAAWLADGKDPAPVLAFVETLGEQIRRPLTEQRWRRTDAEAGLSAGRRRRAAVGWNSEGRPGLLVPGTAASPPMG